ncbi:MAG: hypothetical protein ACOY4R_31405 [Pseudomonadota bacterium]
MKRCCSPIAVERSSRTTGRYLILPVVPAHLPLAWPVLGRLLAPVVRRSPDPDARRLPAVLEAGTAQLWAVVERGVPTAAIVTRLTLGPPKRCLLWLIGGRDARAWAREALARIAAWARAWGCVALWGVGRDGWTRLAASLGFERVAPVGGQRAWERRIA